LDNARDASYCTTLDLSREGLSLRALSTIGGSVPSIISHLSLPKMCAEILWPASR